MRRIIALTLSFILPFALSACTNGRQTKTLPADAPEVQKETPLPEPEGMIKAFGKEIVIACDAPEDGLFARGVSEQADRVGIPLIFISDTKDGEEYDAFIHYGIENANMVTDGVPYVSVITDGGTDENASGMIIYEKSGETDAALDAMFTYPSHEAPVRILGLFDDIESEAAKRYLEMETEGKLQNKGVFIQSDGIVTEDWLAETLSGIGIGVLDTVFAQTPELAQSGFRALRKANRNDAVEICAAGISEEQIKAMQEDHFLMGLALGFDEYGAGMLALRMCAGILAGEKVEKPVKIEPFALYSDEVRTLQKQGVTSPEEVLESLDVRINEECDFAFLEELAEYYIG